MNALHLARVSVMRSGAYPTLCDSSPTSMPLDNRNGTLTVALDQDCPTAVLVLVNTEKPDGMDQEFAWDATFNQTSATVSNGTIELGVTDYGSLIAEGVGVRRADLPETEVLAWGCACEGWGIATAEGASGSVTTNGGAQGLTKESFTRSGNTVTSVTTMGTDLRITHTFKPSADPSLYQVDVRVDRLSPDPFPSTFGPVRYRRAIDWDVAPTPFDEFITWAKADGADDAFVSFLSNDGFARPDPLSPPTDLGSTGYVDRFGPADQGGLIELDLGNIGLFAPAEFTLYFGVTYGVPDALSAVSAVGADLYLLAEPNPGENEQAPVMTAIFAVDGAGLVAAGSPGAARLAPPTAGKEDKAWVKSKPGIRVHQSGPRK